jgi:hypothetical protein
MPKEDDKEVTPVYSYLAPRHSYTDAVAAAIMLQLEKGLTLKQVCSKDGFPAYSDVTKWMKTHHEFKSAVQGILADKLRNLVDEDINRLEAGPEEMSREEAAGHKLYNEKMRWYVERVLKDDYSLTQKHEVTGHVTKVVVNTGIVRDRNAIKEMYGLTDEDFPDYKEPPKTIETEVVVEDDEKKDD